MRFHQIQIFAAVAKHLSVTKAARALHISQPAVSYQLKNLQGDLGVELLTRTGQGVALTEQGRIFYQDCEPLLFNYEKLMKKFMPKPSSIIIEPQVLLLGGSHGPSSLVLPTVMAMFRMNYPSVVPALRTANSHDIEAQVLRSEIELALIVNPVPSPLLTIRPYREEQFLAFVAPGHPLAKRGKLSEAEFAETPLVMRLGREGKSIAADIISDLEDRGIKPNIGMCFESPEAIKIAVREGSGLGILHQDVIKEDIQKGLLKVVKIEGITLRGKSCVVYRKDKPLSAEAETFLKLLYLWRDSSSGGVEGEALPRSSRS